MSEPAEFSPEAQRDYLEAYARGARRQRTLSKLFASLYTSCATGLVLVGTEAVTSGSNFNQAIGSLLISVSIFSGVLAKESFDDITDSHDAYNRYLDLIDRLDANNTPHAGEEMF